MAAAAGAVTVLDWPAWVTVKPGLDVSWQAGTADAFVHGMQWGPALDFTYGPYGFATFLEPFYRSTSLIAFLYVLVVTWCLAALLVLSLRKYWGLGPAAVAAWGAIAFVREPLHVADFASLVALGLAMLLLRSHEQSLREVLAVVLGALASFAFLVKLNTGLVIVALLVVALAGTSCSGRERLAACGGAASAMIVMFVAAWAAAGQSFANIASFAHESVSLVLGYSTAMGSRLVPPDAKWWAIPIGAAAAVSLAAGIRGWQRRQRAAGTLLVMVWGWAVVKEGFVSGNHWPLFFGLALVATVLAGLASPPKLLYTAGMVLAVCIFLDAPSLPSISSPLSSTKAFFTEIGDLAVPGDFSRVQANARARTVAEEPLAARTLSLLRGHTIAIEPWEDLVAWADPAAQWDPEPVVQSYSAYTTGLDRLDARFIGSKKAPQRILVRRFPKGFDDRDFFMDPPATTEAVFCHYSQLALQGPWQVLQRGPDRCGAPVELEQVHADFGEPVKVPVARGDMVVASFRFSLPLVSKLVDVLLKPPFTYLTTWVNRGTPATYRFVTGTAPDFHVLATPAALGYTGRFAPPSVRQVELSGGGWPTGKGSLTIVFWGVPIKS